MKMTEVARGVYVTPCEERNDRPYLGYIRGGRMSVMVDAGNSPAHAAEFLQAAAEEGLRPPSMVMLTHHHWDHTFGLAGIKGALSVSLRDTADELRRLRGYTWDEEHLDGYIADNRIPLFCRPHLKCEYPDLSKIAIALPDVETEGGFSIDIGGETVRFFRVTSPHTDECACVLAERAGVLFVGDANCEEVVGEDWLDNSVKLARETDELERVDFALCVAGHMPPMSKEELLSGFRERLEKLG